MGARESHRASRCVARGAFMARTCALGLDGEPCELTVGSSRQRASNNSNRCARPGALSARLGGVLARLQAWILYAAAAAVYGSGGVVTSAVQLYRSLVPPPRWSSYTCVIEVTEVSLKSFELLSAVGGVQL